MKKTLVAALLGATLLGGGAYAASQDAPAPRAPMTKADANGDGILTRQEAIAAAAARFDRADADKNGQLTAAERQAARPHHGRGLGKHHRAGRGDRGAFRQQMLERFDTDKDGKLSDTERQAARAARKEMRGHGGHMPPPPADAPETPNGN